MATVSERLTAHRWHCAPGVLFVAIAGFLMAACSQKLMPPTEESAQHLPEKFTGEAAGEAYAPLQWWKTFNDPGLDRVVEAVLTSNLDLAEAVARVEQARARAGIANAARYPALQPSASGEDTDTPTNAGVGEQIEEIGLSPELKQEFGISVPDRLAVTTYSLNANFSYEADFWGRNRNDARAARAQHLASEWDYRAARIGVVAETVRTYIEIAWLRRQLKLSDEIVGILQEREKLTTARYQRGLNTARELYTARLQLWNSQAELPAVRGRLADAEGRLWTLLGGYRADLAGMLPDALSPSATFDRIPVGIPADLLTQRPDVGAAQQRMQAARYAVGARRAELLPSLSLSGTIGLQGSDTREWLDAAQWFKNLSLNLVGPVFQGKRLRHNVTLAETRLKEAVFAYRHSVVTAVNEVEAVLTRLETSQQRHALLSSSVEEARAEAAFQERRYGSGVGDYDAFLAASETLTSMKSSLAAAERDLGYMRLALHRALGGVWTAADPEAARIDDSPQVADLRAASPATE
ncbi:MAG: efflux transporter outer membrane subunit [Gammaproteobacteria bacterium]|nr:efflux transporter outer membrane subunit [Gammaproteobacteria bacterium]